MAIKREEVSPLEEVWKDIDGFPGYQASSYGHIRSFRDFRGNITDKSRILSARVNKDGYYELTLYTTEHKKVTKRIHKLVADTFLGPHPGLVVNHIDGNKFNNDISNLEFVTAEMNSTKAAESGLYKTQAVKIVETGEIFRSVRECGAAINSHPSNISQCIAGKNMSSRDLHFEYVSDEEYEKYVNSKKKPFLYPHQEDAIKRMFNGCVLNGTVGSGKSRTGIYYYFQRYGGSVQPFKPMRKGAPDLIIITTAKKRSDLEWERELVPFLLSTKEKNISGNKVFVDSWNNIKKYENRTGCFILFDENKTNGKGAWANAFLKMTKHNEWILLSASNGDRWTDYETLFVAEGFFKNRTEFRREHLIISNYGGFPQVTGYRGEERLFRLRDRVLVDMDFKRHTVQHHEDVYVKYDIQKYKEVIKTRWDCYRDEPITRASGLCHVLRRIVNEDESRQVALLELLEEHPKAIIFYNHDNELDILLNLGYAEGTKIAQYNGHKHEPIPEGDKWVYLVNYNACEAWNSTSTNCIIFFSQNYSYKVMIQAAGRIDRLTTPFTDLYYYHLKSRSGIDLAISKALSQKKKFNEKRWTKWD